MPAVLKARTGAAILLAGAVATFATGAGKPDAAMDYGFVLTSLRLAFYRGDEKIECPDGMSHVVRDAFLATQTPAERARLLKPENSVEFEKRYKEDYVFGPGGRDICTDPAYFDTPDRELQKLDQGRVAPGLNLDGTADGRSPPGGCPHQKFVSPSGEAGVDNQFYRAVACNTFFRPGATEEGDGSGENWRDTPAVVIVRDVQSWENDPSVEVLIAASPDKVTTDATHSIVAGASLSVTHDARYRTVLKGRIQDGVLTTEPADLVLPLNWVGASGGAYIVKHFRLRLRRTADGELRGQAGGYRPIDNAMAVPRVGGPGVASTAGLECASVYKTLRLLADGDADPRTGKCTSVSTALDMAAKPAFVFEDGKLVGAPR